MAAASYYMRRMPPDDELKRLRWRAHHRGIREADLLVGAFFDARCEQWTAEDRAQFAAMLDEQDVDILAWAHGTCAVPERYRGPMMNSLQKRDFLQVAN